MLLSGQLTCQLTAELVIVIGKHGSRLSAAQAKDAIFGVTCGNDVSERDSQGGPAKDLQWWRAKGRILSVHVDRLSLTGWLTATCGCVLD